MSVAYLAIDKNEELHAQEKVQWNKRGIMDIRVDTMTAGIEKAMNKKLLYIVINADNIDYAAELKILREVTNDPILIGTSIFVVEEQIEAMHNGADFYGQFSASHNNMNAVFAVARRVDERAKQQKVSTDVIAYSGVLLSSTYRQVFVEDKEVIFTRKEFDILHLMMRNLGRVLTQDQILCQVWGGEYEDADKNVLWNAIKRLREKLNAAGGRDYIETVRDVGYKFPLNHHIKHITREKVH